MIFDRGGNSRIFKNQGDSLLNAAEAQWVGS